MSRKKSMQNWKVIHSLAESLRPLVGSDEEATKKLDEAQKLAETQQGPRHVDDFIDDPSSDPYASSWLEAFRRPAIDKLREPDTRKLFATWKGTRYRVTGCSRLGDVWLHANVNEDTTYQHRVNVDECSDWSPEPGSTSAVPRE